MPPLKNPRHEQFAQLLSQTPPPSKASAYAAVGFVEDHGHASRLADHPLVKARIADLKAQVAKLLASKQAAEEAKIIAKVVFTRQSLLEMSAAAFKVAESECNPQAMCQAVRLIAELSLISLKAPEDKPAAQQHLHLHETGLIDRPPQESLEQWLDRKKQEADARATSKTLKIVGKPLDS